MKSKTLSPKSSSVSKKLGSYGKKMKDGGSLGMKSVKAGFDNNPGVTRADIITAATKKAKKGMKVKKAEVGKTIEKIANTKLSDVPQKTKNVAKKAVNKMKNMTVGDAADVLTMGGYSTAKDIYRRVKGKKAKSGTTMKKCRYGCK